MKPLRFLVLLAVLGLSRAVAEPRAINGVAVIVNESIITFGEVTELAEPGIEAIQRNPSLSPQEKQERFVALQNDTVEQLVRRQLILHDFKSAGYALPESVFDDEIKRRIRSQFGDRLTLTKTLQAQGKTYESYRRQIREQIIVDILTQKNVGSVLLVSPYKIERYYKENQDKFVVEDQVKLRMIVLNKPPGGDAAGVTRLAKEILLKLEEGANFAEMAAIHSEGSQRAQQGDWGWVEKSVLRKELADVAFALKPGQRSGVIETPEACYLMLVEEARQSQVRPLVEIRDEIEKTLIGEERGRLLDTYIDRLKKKSFIRSY